MGSTLAFLLELLVVFAAIGQLLCVDSYVVEESKRSTETCTAGITTSLIHRDDYFDNDRLAKKEKIVRDLRRSTLRKLSLVSKTKLSGTAASPNPAPGSQDWETSVSDASIAEYLMQISLGTPAQTFVAVADTGSDLTWLQCSPCSACSSSSCGSCEGAVLSPTSSSTYVPLSCSSATCLFLNETGASCPVSAQAPSTGCDYSYGYEDGSQTTGLLAQDTITMQTVTGGFQTVRNYQFGCSQQTFSNSALLDASDGLVGLGRGNISFPSQLGTLFGKKFGYCLVHRSESSIVESSPLFFGSDAVPATSKNGPQLQYIPLNTSQFAGRTFYYVGCEGITLNGEPVSNISASDFELQNFGEGGIFFDSGTTFTFLFDQILNPLIDALVKQITHHTADTSAESGFPLCFSASWSDWVSDKGVPIISFQFSNTSGYPLYVDTTWFELNSTTVCLNMLGSTSNFNIFGNRQQVGYHILYDLEKEQIGFVQADCSTPQLVGTPSSPSPLASIGPSQVSASARFEAMISEFGSILGNLAP